MHKITIEPLTQSSFAGFGDVVEVDGADVIGINQGFAERVNGLATIDVAAEGGHVNVSLFCSRPRPRPVAIEIMERHPLGSQLFYPLQDAPWLVLVCGNPQDAASYRAFLASGLQGVNYSKGVWHHPLLVLNDGERFIVVDRGGPGGNLDEVRLNDQPGLYLAP